MNKRIGVLTSGGDCPGLNAAIRAVYLRAAADGIEVAGIKNGWRGLVDDEMEVLTETDVADMLPRGGTILGTSRINPLEQDWTAEKLRQNFVKNGLSSIIVMGGDGSLSAACELWERHEGPLVGLPKTIDNDLAGTDKRSALRRRFTSLPNQLTACGQPPTRIRE